MEEYAAAQFLRLLLLTVPADIDLTSLIPQLDTVASDITSHQRDAVSQRKDLAQRAREFKKLDDASKLAEWKALQKCRATD